MNHLRYFYFMMVAAVVFGSGLTLGALFLAMPAIQKSRPMGYWFDVRSMEVFHAIEGTCPVVRVDRTIYLDFEARWVAKLWVKTDRGRWITFNPTGPDAPPMRGGGPYDPRAELPDPMFLSWWLGGANTPKCPWMRAGEYKLTVTWEQDHPFWNPDPLKMDANDGDPFEVRRRKMEG